MANCWKNANHKLYCTVLYYYLLKYDIPHQHKTKTDQSIQLKIVVCQFETESVMINMSTDYIYAGVIVWLSGIAYPISIHTHTYNL